MGEGRYELTKQIIIRRTAEIVRSKILLDHASEWSDLFDMRWSSEPAEIVVLYESVQPLRLKEGELYT